MFKNVRVKPLWVEYFKLGNTCQVYYVFQCSQFSGLNTSMFVIIKVVLFWCVSSSIFFIGSLNILIFYLVLLNAIPSEDKSLFRLSHNSISSKWKIVKTAVEIPLKYCGTFPDSAKRFFHNFFFTSHSSFEFFCDFIFNFLRHALTNFQGSSISHSKRLYQFD